MTDTTRTTLPGSEKTPIAGARISGPTPAGERIDVTVRLRPGAPLSGSTSAPSALGDVLPGQRRYLSREAYAEAHGASDADVAAVAAFAASHGLALVETHKGRRSMVLAGTAASLGEAFGTQLHEYEHDGGTYRGRTGSLSVPAALDGIVAGVFGLDDRPQAKAHFQRLRPPLAASAAAADAPVSARAASANTAYTPPQIAQAYQFPSGADGSGQCIALIELGGGFRPADLQTYFTGLGLPVPKVTAVRVDGGRNHPTTADGADGEVMLDIEVAAAVAPKAAIVVYFAPNTNQGFLDAITTAVHDTVNKPSVVSISWGSAEANWTGQAMTQFDQAFQAAAALGVTICCAAGDNGSADGLTDGGDHADFPASSPHALACGGTKLAASGAVITSEVVWNEGTNSATGGGISRVFPLPDYQTSIKVPPEAHTGHVGRGLPDVAGDADPASGYRVRVDGQDMVIGGTSAVAPLWAGLIALMNQQLGTPVGFLNPLIYGSLRGKGLFHDVTSGNNGSYQAGPGWDACTGWGSPDGTTLLQALRG